MWTTAARNNAPKHRRNRRLRTLNHLAALLDCLRTEREGNQVA
jgi:hypothetical protein